MGLKHGIVLVASSGLAALILLASFFFPGTWIADVVEVQQRVLKPGKRNTRSTIGQDYDRGQLNKIVAWAKKRAPKTGRRNTRSTIGHDHDRKRLNKIAARA